MPAATNFLAASLLCSGISQRCLWINPKGHQVLLTAEAKTETPVFGAVRVYQQKHAVAI